MPLPLFYRRENRCRGPSPSQDQTMREQESQSSQPISTATLFCLCGKGSFTLRLTWASVCTASLLSPLFPASWPFHHQELKKQKHLLHAFLMLWGLYTEHSWWGLERKIFIYQKRRRNTPTRPDLAPHYQTWHREGAAEPLLNSTEVEGMKGNSYCVIWLHFGIS